MSPLAPVSLNRSKSGPELKYDPALAKSVAKKLMGEHYTEENLSKWNNSEITLFRLVLVLVYLMIFLIADCWRELSPPTGVPYPRGS